ncbi:MAG: class I SAM-dependent methyltransferase [Rhizobiales bacterium]|nr:class I SAM-dependent methyltransferase [Hyphomicrobiales bacterium]
MSTTAIILEGAILDYYRAHAFREPPLLAELRKETAAFGEDAVMQIAPEQGAFMGLLAQLMGARRILEIGTFTGYSSLAVALATEAHITAVDVSKEWTDLARRFWKKAGVEARITLRLDGGHAAIADLLAGGEAGSFDMVFLDADKSSYDAYYEGGLKLLRKGGLMLVDNVLWGGDVADPGKRDADTSALRALNAKIATDPRVSHCMLPIADGLTLARKL